VPTLIELVVDRSALFNDLEVADVHEDLYRNIASIKSSQYLFDDIADTLQDQEVLTSHEIQYKTSTYTSEQPIIDRPFEEAKYNEAIQYPFENWQQSRFSNGSFGVWYGASDLQTTIDETAYHWKNDLLTDAGWQNVEDVVSERKVYRVACDALLINFLPKIHSHPELVDPTNYFLTNQIGERLHHEGHPGLMGQSARGEGTVFAIFKPDVLSSPRNICYLTYKLKHGAVEVENR